MSGCALVSGRLVTSVHTTGLLPSTSQSDVEIEIPSETTNLVLWRLARAGIAALDSTSIERPLCRFALSLETTGDSVTNLLRAERVRRVSPPALATPCAPEAASANDFADVRPTDCTGSSEDEDAGADDDVDDDDVDGADDADDDDDDDADDGGNDEDELGDVRITGGTDRASCTSPNGRTPQVLQTNLMNTLQCCSIS